MATAHRVARSCVLRSFLPALLALSGAGLLCQASLAAGDPPRKKRAESFLGVHFDFHAGDDCRRVGERTTPEMVESVIDKVQPDYLQIDCKGHRGYSSYPTKVGNPAPGFVGDPLRIWREVTRRRGIALYLHYSGVWDYHAVAAHPAWAAINADGKPNDKATSVFGPYVDELLIPQLRELAGVYGADGVWVDGDCWGTTPDYGAAAVREFCQQTGAETAPRQAGDPHWNEWMDFHRDGFRRYLRHYVDELRASHPDFQVISNWAFSDHMPEPVSAGVAGLSGDFSPDDSVNSARFSGRCLENQGVPWDLMSWSFSRQTRQQKPAVQLDAGSRRRALAGRRLPGLFQAGSGRRDPQSGGDGRDGRRLPSTAASGRPSAIARSPCRKSPCSIRRPATTALHRDSSIGRAAPG